MLGLTPAPAGARFHGTLPDLGVPVHIAEYGNDLRLCAYSVAADPTVGVEAHRVYRTWVYGVDREKWVQRALPDQPRPLYRVENLERYPDWPVYIFEREDMVDSFHQLSGDTEVIATTVPGGAGAFEMGEWEPLYGRRVTLWPTHRTDCEAAMHQLARKLEKAGCTVKILTIPQDQPQDWSFLHVIEANWSWLQVELFLSVNLREVQGQVVPIGPARARSGSAVHVSEPATVTELHPKKAKQPPLQVQSWRDVWERIPGLTFATNGTPFSNTYNVLVVITQQQLDVWYDEFHCRVMTDTQNPRFWLEHDTTELMCRLQGQLGLAGARWESVEQAVRALARRTLRHEVRDWLATLEWDQQNRLALMLPIAFHTLKTPYFTSVGRCFLMAAVARVFKPGCQVDYVPVFEGRGELNKTSSLRVLFGKWFDNPSAMMGDKDFLQNMCGKWCLELGELANVKGRPLEVVKSLITRPVDTYRSSYGRAPGDYPRQCVFAGTVDRSDWNADEAGGRRWWPVAVGREINLEWLYENRDQLFAEAAYRVNDGEPWHNVDKRDAAIEQAARRPGEPWRQMVARYLEGQKETTFENVMAGALGFDKPKDWKPGDIHRVELALKQLGWSERDSGKRWVAPAG